MKTIITTLLLVIAVATTGSSQKYGHINSQEIIAAFPEVKAADSEVESYSNQLIQKGQAMMKEYEASYQDYASKANSGELSQLQMQQAEQALGAKQQEIQKYEVEVQNMIAQKKQETYQPLLDKIQAVIVEVGKEQGYTMIFDSSSLGMVYTKESEDIMDVVKARLGIQ